MRHSSAVLIVFVLLTSGGCSTRGDRPDLGQVSGTITLDGTPLANGWILFSPDGFRPSRGFTDEAGRYELTYLRDIKGAVVGTHLVTIDRLPASEMATVEHLPARYNKQSTMSYEVKPGKNEFDFELTSASE